MKRRVVMVSRIFSVALLLVILFISLSCEKAGLTSVIVDPNTTWSFSGDIQPIFTSNCITCHGGTRSPDLRAGKSYTSLTGGGFVSTPAENSVLYSTMTGSAHSPRSTDEQKLKVFYWIKQGAKNN